MSRRLVFILAALALVVAAAFAAFSWTLTSSGPEAVLAQQLRKGYGLELDVKGESTLSILPTPRVKLENVNISGLGERLSVKNATLRGELSLLPLLLGRIELADVALSNAETVLDARNTSDSFWASWAAWLQLRGTGNFIKKIIVSDSSLTILREKHEDILLDRINTVIDWPDSASPLFLSGAFSWNGKTISITKANFLPPALLSGGNSLFALELSLPDSQLALAGTIQFDKSWNATVTGKSQLKTESLKQLTSWANLPIPLSPLIEKFSIEGDFSTTKNIISWPQIAIAMDNNRLEGSLSFRFDAVGYTVSGTLATDALELTPFLAPLADLHNSGNLGLSLADINRTDLDLRLSATSSTIGQLKLSDLALGLLVKPDRFEATLGRVSFERGIVKGRLILSGLPPQRDMKLQANINELNLGRLFAGAGLETALTGTAQGNLSLEGTGSSFEDILQKTHGRLSLAVTNGEFKAFSIPETLKRLGSADATGEIAPQTGATPFSLARIGMIVEAGTGFITDGTIQTENARASLNGDMSLVDRTIAVSTVITPDGRTDGADVVITASGPWATPKTTARITEKPKTDMPVSPEDNNLPAPTQAD